MNENTIIISQATRKLHLQGIVNLQKENLPNHISDQEAKEQGFVTLEHTVDMLDDMNKPYPHIVALQNNKVIGYTLSMLKEHKERFPVLLPIANTIDTLSYKGISLIDSQYFIMGQVCIEKQCRGQGLFYTLYAALEVQMKDDFDFMITVISNQNTRSIRAHEKFGFETILIDTSEGRDWVIVLKELS